MGLKSALKRFTDKVVAKTVEAMTPDGVEEDSYLDLKLEAIEGRRMRGYEAPEPAAVGPATPVFRSDGQIHNFAAIPFPGTGRKLTKAQYDARYAGARPRPKHSVATHVDAEDEKSKPTLPQHPWDE
jgi:hypothetical protein